MGTQDWPKGPGRRPGADGFGPRSMMTRSGTGGGNFWQAHAMARTLGVNLTDLRLQGGLDAGGLGRIASACESCRALAECVGFVADPPSETDAAPEFCPVADVFGRLMRLSAGRR